MYTLNLNDHSLSTLLNASAAFIDHMIECDTYCRLISIDTSIEMDTILWHIDDFGMEPGDNIKLTDDLERYLRILCAWIEDEHPNDPELLDLAHDLNSQLQG